MSTLRSRTIRLAASLPPGDPLRRLLLVAAKDSEEGATDKLLDLLEANGLEVTDLIDFAAFNFDMPGQEGQPPKVVAKNLAAWWGGKAPKYWADVSPKDLQAMTQAFQVALPGLGGLAHKLLGNGKGKGKAEDGGEEGSKKKAGGGLVVLAAAAMVHKAAQDQKAAKRDWEEREERAKERDRSWSQPKGPEVSNSRFESKKDGKTHTFTGTHKEWREWWDKLGYEDYTWAKEKVGGDPIAFDAWKKASPAPSVWFGDQPVDKVLPILLDHEETKLAYVVRKVIDEKGEDADLKAEVESRVAAEKTRIEKAYRAERRKTVDAEISKDDGLKFSAMYWQEMDHGGSAFERLVGIFAPDWRAKKVKQRVEEKLQKEKDEDQAANAGRSYDDYVADKKQKGERPMDREHWEARYNK